MITYIIQTIIFQLVFLALYELLLKKETFFQWNRVYLLATPIIALLLPLIKVPALQTFIPQNFIVSLPEITLGAATAATQNNLATASPNLSLLEIILITGMAISTLLFVWKLYKILRLKRKGIHESIENCTIVHLPNSTDAFSFAGTIFLGENLNQNSKEHILAHERVHVNQKHYLDLLYFEVLRIVFWFNPMVYLYQKRIATLQEYIADAEVVSKSGKTSYYQNILSEVFQTQSISFVNTFFNHSLIKKRIVMLHKSKSKKLQLIKYLLLLPVMATMLFYTSCSQELKSEQEVSIENKILELKILIENDPDITEVQREAYLKWVDQLNLSETDTDRMLKGFIEGYNNPQYSNNSISHVPFAVIEQVPIYPGCENLLTNEERKQCMVENLNNLVVENFNTSIADGSGLKARVRVNVQFKIDEQGNVVDILSRAPNNLLEEEAKRVISLIPKMNPGMQNGKPVAVLYSLPIAFETKK